MFVIEVTPWVRGDAFSCSICALSLTSLPLSVTVGQMRPGKQPEPPRPANRVSLSDVVRGLRDAEAVPNVPDGDAQQRTATRARDVSQPDVANMPDDQKRYKPEPAPPPPPQQQQPPAAPPAAATRARRSRSGASNAPDETDATKRARLASERDASRKTDAEREAAENAAKEKRRADAAAEKAKSATKVDEAKRALASAGRK